MLKSKKVIFLIKGLDLLFGASFEIIFGNILIAL